MADKRIKDLTNTATEADLVAGKYFALDDSTGTKKLPAEYLAKQSVQEGLVFINSEFLYKYSGNFSNTAGGYLYKELTLLDTAVTNDYSYLYVKVDSDVTEITYYSIYFYDSNNVSLGSTAPLSFNEGYWVKVKNGAKKLVVSGGTNPIANVRNFIINARIYERSFYERFFDGQDDSRFKILERVNPVEVVEYVYDVAVNSGNKFNKAFDTLSLAIANDYTYIELFTQSATTDISTYTVYFWNSSNTLISSVAGIKLNELCWVKVPIGTKKIQAYNGTVLSNSTTFNIEASVYERSSYERIFDEQIDSRFESIENVNSDLLYKYNGVFSNTVGGYLLKDLTSFNSVVDNDYTYVQIEVDSDVTEITYYRLYFYDENNVSLGSSDPLSFNTKYGIKVKNGTKKITVSGGANAIATVRNFDISALVYEVSLYERTLIAQTIHDCYWFSGKKVMCIGDSITQFSYNGKSYVDYLKEMTGAVAINAGVGGTRYAPRGESTSTPSTSAQAYANLDIYNRVHAWATTNDWTNIDAAVSYLATQGIYIAGHISAMKNNPIAGVDAVILLAGTNDFTAGTALGDVDSVDTTKTLGALNKIIEELLTANGNLKIFVLTPTIRYMEDNRTDPYFSDNWINAMGITLKEESAKIQECAVKNHIPVCDLYNTLGWNKWNFSTYFADNDSTHPKKGYDSLARRVAEFVKANGF